jgi:hypothetical protein
MTGESGHCTGSYCPFRRTNRHGFPENRHGYFANPSICPLFGGIMPIACPEKAAFGTVMGADNSQNGLQYVMTRNTGILDHVPIRISPGGHYERDETGPESGSDWLSRRVNRHGFLENRHGYFTNPSICPRIDCMMPTACPEKAAFSTVWREDNSQNGLQYAERMGTGDWGQFPLRMEREYRGPGYRAGRKNNEQDNNPRENQV